MLSMGVVRGISYGLFGPPDDFGEGARGLNATAELATARSGLGRLDRRPAQWVQSRKTSIRAPRALSRFGRSS